MKVYFTILNVFKKSSLGYNYAAFWKFETTGHILKNSKFEMRISSKKGSKIIVTSFSLNKIKVKAYFTILEVFNISSFGYDYASIWKLEKNWHFKKKRNLKWEYLPKKGSRVIVTSFSQTYTIVKVYFTILDNFNISSLDYNYAAIWKL